LLRFNVTEACSVFSNTCVFEKRRSIHRPPPGCRKTNSSAAW